MVEEEEKVWMGRAVGSGERGAVSGGDGGVVGIAAAMMEQEHGGGGALW